MKTNTNYSFQIIASIFLISTIVFAGLFFSTEKTTCPEAEEIPCPIPEEKGMIFGNLNEWGEDYYDSSKYLLMVDIFNFGSNEAKNVEVTCEISVGDEEGYEITDYPVNTKKKRIGNIASESYKIVEIEMDKKPKEEGDYPLAICKVTYCENCEILSEKIEEFN